MYFTDKASLGDKASAPANTLTYILVDNGHSLITAGFASRVSSANRIVNVEAYDVHCSGHQSLLSANRLASLFNISGTACCLIKELAFFSGNQSLLRWLSSQSMSLTTSVTSIG